MTRNIYKALLFSHPNLGTSHFSYSLRHGAFHLFFKKFLNLNVDRCLFFCLFLLAIVLYVLLRFMASDYPFGVFKLFSLLKGKLLLKKGLFSSKHISCCAFVSVSLLNKGFHNIKMYLFCSFRYALKVHEHFMCVLS